MIPKLNKPVKQVANTIQRKYGRGFMVTIDHVHKTVLVEFTLPREDVFMQASEIVNIFMLKGYDNRD